MSIGINRQFGSSSSADAPTVKDNSKQIDFKIPSEEDIKDQLPHKQMHSIALQEKAMWSWDVSKDETLSNNKVNKLSAYNFFGTNPMVQNSFVWNLAKALFISNRTPDSSCIYERVRSHENAKLLYRSPNSSAV